MGRQMWRYAAFETNIMTIFKLCKKYSIKHTELNGGYQVRLLDGVLDLYPVRKKWHYLVDNTRGAWEDNKELEEIFKDLVEYHVNGRK